MRIAVIGAGHAGIEAARAAAAMGARVILLTTSLESIALMSCNPAIGGIAKGHLVREIDLLGGLMGRAADATGIHFRTLNQTKGPAVRATRSQNDKEAYHLHMKNLLQRIQGLELYQGIATAVRITGGRASGVILLDGKTIPADAVVLAPGTFLNGLIHIGSSHYPAGRANEPASSELAAWLKNLGLPVMRLKTGTPMRLSAPTVDWTHFQPQAGDEPAPVFSIFSRRPGRNRVHCFLGYTNAETRKVILDNLDQSPLYSGTICGTGPRYCPSIEDKIVKFPERPRHHFYLEPEGLRSREIYVNGLSTSLPVTVQEQILASIPGLDRARMTRPGYAIEYDALQPSRLGKNLEISGTERLFAAGQICGTSGYEEAAGQGLLAGINAVLAVRGEPPFILDRHEAYLGVLIDDITSRGVDEPYRLFTSRAEYRLQLREDNVAERLATHAGRLGLLPPPILRRLARQGELRRKKLEELSRVKIRTDRGRTGADELLKNPDLKLRDLTPHLGSEFFRDLRPADETFLEAEIKYKGYIAIQNREVAASARQAAITLPADLDFNKIPGLSTEIRQKLGARKPSNLGQAARLPGMTPAALRAVAIYLAVSAKKKNHQE